MEVRNSPNTIFQTGPQARYWIIMEKLRKWKKGMEAKALRVNADKTKVMQCRVSRFQSEDSGEHPCGVCRKGVVDNVILFVGCLGGFTKDVVAFQES